MTTFHMSFRQYARTARHFASARLPEVLALQASPVLGGFLGGFSFERGRVIRFGLLLLGSFALTAHVFVFNDWSGQSSDLRDPRRTALVFARRGISSRQVAHVAIALLLFANIAFAAAGGIQAILFGAGITILSLLYSCSPSFGKSTPIAASLNHLLGGVLHFLLGYTAFRTLNAGGLVLSLFFGLVFAGGHLNQEIRDYDGDLLNGIRTSAVAFGCRRAFFASLCIFTAAYWVLIGSAAVGILPKPLLWCAVVLWVLHFACSLEALRRGLGFETAVWIQRRYRLLFALIGIAIIICNFRF